MELNLARMQIQDTFNGAYVNKTAVRNNKGSSSESIAISAPLPAVQQVGDVSLSGESVPAASAIKGDEKGRLSNASTKMNKEEVEKLVKSIQEDADLLKTRMSFKVDEKSGETIVSIQDAKTGETLKQLPPEELLKIRTAFKELIKGILLDAKA